MAERRMFTKKVTDDDNFMALSSSAQALYLHLSMSADDDGFCNQVSISMFKAHASVQDLQALLEKRYVYQFENGVIVIKHWRMANALRKDRYTATAFQEELSKLRLKDNGVYTLSDDGEHIRALPVEEQEDGSETNRQAAYRESSLPYSFDYKIRNAFYGKLCPICGAKMEKSIDEAGVVSDNRMPTIQHNLPISKGGKHELGNISVICRQCNVTIQDTETEALNADEVAETWEKLDGCLLVAVCLPQDRLDKNSIDNNISCASAAPPHDTTRGGDPAADKGCRKGRDTEVDEFFERVWALYPRKRGKGAVSKTAKKEIFKAGFDVVSRAIEKYKDEIERLHKQEEYILIGSTFFNTRWRDYVDEESDKGEEISIWQMKSEDIDEMEGTY